MYVHISICVYIYVFVYIRNFHKTFISFFACVKYMCIQYYVMRCLFYDLGWGSPPNINAVACQGVQRLLFHPGWDHHVWKEGVPRGPLR